MKLWKRAVAVMLVLLIACSLIQPVSAVTYSKTTMDSILTSWNNSSYSESTSNSYNGATQCAAFTRYAFVQLWGHNDTTNNANVTYNYYDCTTASSLLNTLITKAAPGDSIRVTKLSSSGGETSSTHIMHLYDINTSNKILVYESNYGTKNKGRYHTYSSVSVLVSDCTGVTTSSGQFSSTIRLKVMHSKNNSQTCANLSVNGGTTPPSTPTITNLSATNITKTNAYLSATVNKSAGTTVSTCGIYLGTTSSNMTKRNTETVGSAANNHNSGTSFNIYYDLNDELNITLSAGTTYYYKFYCTVGSTTYTSDTKSFTTAADTVTITNPGASSITQTDAYISATVNKTASTTVSTCGIYLGTSASNMTKRNTETVGSAANNHNSGKSFNIFYDLTDELNIVLTPGTTYYYKFYCTVGSSNYYSATASFTTTACSHSWGSGTVTTAATCTAAGVRTYTCSNCGSTKTESIAALGHNWNDGVVTVQPTETEKGEKTFTCRRCGATRTEEIPEKAHEHSYTVTVTPPTCTEQGYTTHTCSCGDSYVDTYVPALGHDIVKDAAAAPTCTETGLTEGEHCTRCDYKNAQDVVPALGHDLVTDTAVAPTCTETGLTEGEHCTRCDYKNAQDVVPALGHDLVTDTAVAATCTATGLTAGEHCTRCDYKVAQETVPALGHSWDAGVVTVQPTETEKGEKTFTCARCGETKTETIPELSHVHSYTDVVTPPTCTEKGYTTHTCACGDSYVDTYVGALGHIWDAGIITEQPTETKDGVKTFTCSRCGATRTETIPATGEDKPCDGGATCPSKNFKDVKAGDWYHLAVDFAVKEGLFKGMTETTFEPNTPMTRGMLVTVLWRYEGSPKEGKSDFTDLTADWYKEAVAWAASKGIVTGVGNGRFDPDGKITREQLAAILYRYSKNKGYDTSKQSDFAGFPDKGKISDWAKEAYGWAVGVGLITGNDGKLDPQGNATRAQVSTILMRFIEGIAK